MEKKAIIFDLDDTLRKIERTNDMNVLLRPHINELLTRLQKAEESGIDIIIWTTATSQSVQESFLNLLQEEYRDIFTRIIDRDHNVLPESGSIEEQIYSDGIAKPITSLKEYQQLLFFDDNANTEGYKLKQLYKDESLAPDQQVVFASYRYEPIGTDRIYAYTMLAKEIAESNPEFAIKTNELLTQIGQEPGCELMIEMIDEFQKLEYRKGLITDENDTTMKMKEKSNKMSEYRNGENGINDILDIIDLTLLRNDDLNQKVEEYLLEFSQAKTKNKTKKESEAPEL